VLVAAAVLACGKVATNVDQVIAIDVVLPDSIRVADTIYALGRALNGRGDSVAAEIIWSSLDPAILVVADSTTGKTYGKAVGTGRLQARVGALRSNPQSVIVRGP
jgi:hypothetical protein